MNTIERRSAVRHPVGENRARIMWDEGPGPMVTPARLVDLSRGGVGLVSESPLPAGREVCIRLEAPRETGWILAQVVRSDGATEGGLSFTRDFHYDYFACAI